MASTSAPSVQKSFTYDVFLSFRGEDTRKNFVDHLYRALHQKGIRTYKDDERIEKGERINEQLIKAIEDSRFYIIVFSKNYASSSWCLDELVKIMEWQKMPEHKAYPVFYDVEPTQVRHQSGPVEEAFAKLIGKGKRKRTLEDADVEKDVGIWRAFKGYVGEAFANLVGKGKRKRTEAAGRWRDALEEAADLVGWELKNTLDGHEAKFIQQIVENFLLKLHLVNPSIDAKLVGMETRVENFVLSLETCSDDKRMIGIKGMGGIGKTTLAKAVYHRMSVWFEGKSFVENVREVSKGPGLKKLQKQVLKDVLNDQSIDVTSVADGEYKMKNMMQSRKVLVVLDDVDEAEQLEALAGDLIWFGPGTRIIITTRNEQVLVAHGVSIIHDVNLLSDEEALCLFNMYAFKYEIPYLGYEDLSRKVVRYAAGLPLTIKVLGSHLCGRPHHIWEDVIERLKTIPEDKTLKRLELSYDSLENDEKEIFLDVVCILKGEEKDNAIKILESCGYRAEIDLSVLEQKSLITISYNSLTCHDLIQEMGWNIVRRLHPNEPSKHSRLWIKEEIEDVLVKKLGTKETRSIRFDYDVNPTTIMKGLRKMKNLRLLYKNKVDYYYIKDLPEVEVDEVRQYLPDTLQSLCWRNYPIRSLPETFQANNLVNLNMSRSNIHELWNGGERKDLNKLRFVNLSYSKLRNFDLRATPHLEVLNLGGCADLVELQFPVECLNLKVLNIMDSKVISLNLGMIPHLEELNLNYCHDFEELHMPVECLNLKVLNFIWTKVSSINFGLAPYLERLELTGCYHSIYGPIDLCVCKNLEYTVAAICDLQHLRELSLTHTIPQDLWQDLWQLQSLEKLTLYFHVFQHLPDVICMLKHLKSLSLNACDDLEQLPENICKLGYLEELLITNCTSLRGIPDSICNMKCLKRLQIIYCLNVMKLPEELGSLECLENLLIEDTGISVLPQSIYQLKGLCINGTIGGSKFYNVKL